jgi:hypothetical protein
MLFPPPRVSPLVRRGPLHADVRVVENPEAAALISSLRDMIRRQATEIENLQTLANRPPEPRENLGTAAMVSSLSEQLQLQTGEIDTLHRRLADATRAHEDEVRPHLIPQPA